MPSRRTKPRASALRGRFARTGGARATAARERRAAEGDAGGQHRPFVDLVHRGALPRLDALASVRSRFTDERARSERAPLCDRSRQRRALASAVGRRRKARAQNDSAAGAAPEPGRRVVGCGLGSCTTSATATIDSGRRFCAGAPRTLVAVDVDPARHWRTSSCPRTDACELGFRLPPSRRTHDHRNARTHCLSLRREALELRQGSRGADVEPVWCQSHRLASGRAARRRGSVQRTTRKLSLTEAGAAFHARTLQVMVDLADAEAEAQETALRPRGNLRVSAPVVFGQQFVAPLLDALLQALSGAHDRAQFDRSLRRPDRRRDGSRDPHSARSPTRGLIARRLCNESPRAGRVASYLERRGVPSHPSELANHDCVLFTSFARPREWKLLGPEGPVSVSVSGRMASNNADVAASSAKRGHGITVGATLVVGAALRSGELVRVLSDWEFENSGIFALYPSARQLSTKVRATVDFLAEHLKDPRAGTDCSSAYPGFGQTLPWLVADSTLSPLGAHERFRECSFSLGARGVPRAARTVPGSRPAGA